MKTYLLLLSIIICSSLFSQENGGPYMPDENTVLLMHFDGDASNSATAGNDGIIQGTGVTFENDGVHGQCIRLDNSNSGIQSWIEVPFYNELNFGEEFSIECWFKINSWGENTSGIRSLFRKDGDSWAADYEVIFYPEGSSIQANLDCIDDTASWAIDAGTIDILDLNAWYHIAMYYNHAHKSMYLLVRDENYNEIYAARGYAETPPVNSEGKLMIGYGGWSESLFDGWIDEFRISNIYRKYRDDVLKDIDVSSFKDSVYLPLKDKWTSGNGWPLTAYFPVNSETGEVEGGPSCGPTMLMRTIHYWEHPRFPSGNYNYVEDNCHWIADLDNTEYLYDKMLGTFNSNTTEEEYAASATLSAQVTTVARRFSTYGMPKFLKENFLFSEKTRVLFREEYTKEEWENIYKNELNNSRPVMMGGVSARTSTGGSGHYYVCYGYNSQNKFCTDYSFNDEVWVDIDNFYWGIAVDILAFAEPDWNDKTLTLTSPSGNDYYKTGTDIEISWESENINHVILEYSTDAGKNWQTIADNIDANVGEYLWTIPETISKEYKVRISDMEDGNVYRRSNTFNVFDQVNLSFDYPNVNTFIEKGVTQPVYWDSEGMKDFKLEYSTDSQNWIILKDSVIASYGIVNCLFPENTDQQAILKATNLADNTLTFFSESFNLQSQREFGGVNQPDENTILLMHFEEDLSNSASNNLIPIEDISSGYFEDNYELNLGKSFRFDNSDGTPLTHNIWIDNSETLDMGNNWSIEAWVNVRSIGGEHNVGGLIVDKWEALGINAAWHHFNAFVNFDNGTNVEFSYPDAYVLNQWYHVAMISDAAREHIYFYVHDSDFNKLYEEIKAFPEGSNGSVAQSDYLLKVGGLGGASNLEFDGFMDEIRVSKTSYLFNYNPSGICDNTKNGISLNIYPNPVSESTIISFQTNTYGNVNLSVYDIQGRKICTLLDKTLNAGVHTIPIENSISNSGVYFCRMATSKDVLTLKLIVK